MKNLKFITVLGLLLLTFVAVNKAQDKEETAIKVDTLLLNIPVIVSDSQGRYLADLKKEDFTVTQNGKKQAIEFFSGTEVPMNVAIVLDLSPSTQPVLGDIKKAAQEFIKVLRPEDKCMVVGFSREMKIFSELTSDPQKLTKALKKADMMRPIASNMQDTLYEIQTSEFASLEGRKAIIVLTDGMVRGYTVSDRQLLNTFIEGETLVYPIYFQNPYVKFPLPDLTKVTPEQLNQTPLGYLNALALASGGKLNVAKAISFKDAFQSIANELKVQYVLGFYPEKDDAGKLLPLLSVEVNRANAVIRTKKVIRLKTPPAGQAN